MIIIGIAGYIGSGKTEVCKILQKKYKIPIIYTDKIAKYIYLKDKKVVLKLVSVFGKDILDKNVLNTKKLGEFVFKSKENLLLLEDIIHPKMIKVQTEIVDFFKKQKKNKKMLAIESALLVKLNQYKICDYSILVRSPEKMRISRVSKGMVNRLKFQDNLDSIEYDYIIHNDSSLNLLEIKVDEVMKKILNDSYYEVF